MISITSSGQSSFTKWIRIIKTATRSGEQFEIWSQSRSLSNQTRKFEQYERKHNRSQNQKIIKCGELHTSQHTIKHTDMWHEVKRDVALVPERANAQQEIVGTPLFKTAIEPMCKKDKYVKLRATVCVPSGTHRATFSVDTVKHLQTHRIIPDAQHRKGQLLSLA